MASMKHLKDALKGTQKRLERAEALLLEQRNMIWEHVHAPMGFDGINHKEALLEKVEVFLSTPIDTHE